jgi:hypothetical protein
MTSATFVSSGFARAEGDPERAEIQLAALLDCLAPA